MCDEKLNSIKLSAGSQCVIWLRSIRDVCFSRIPLICSCFSFPEYLRVRSHDPEEAIRHDVIVSIVTAAKKDLSLVNDALLNFVKERTLDKRVSEQIVSVCLKVFVLLLLWV